MEMRNAHCPTRILSPLTALVPPGRNRPASGQRSSYRYQPTYKEFLKMSIAEARLEIRYRRIDDLKPDPRNPRQHTRKQIQQLARSIETFGFTVPALVDRDDNVIAGHGRILACRELGWSEIPTVMIDGLSEAKRRALMIADNRLAENAAWDERLLAEQLKDLSLAELDFSLDIIGFEMGEIDLKIAGIEGESAAEDPADAVAEPAAGPPVSKPGDLWLLGDHRVLCGSVLDTATVPTLMGEERAAMVFTDPPYNVPID